MTSNPAPRHTSSLRDTLAEAAARGEADEPGIGGVDGAAHRTEACPRLGRILAGMSQLDALHAQIIGDLIALQSTGEVVESTGIGLELWLSQTGRATFSDRRMLQTAATILARMPNTMSAFQDRRLSWSQVRTIVCSVRQLSVDLQRSVDVALGEEIDTYRNSEPDDLIRRLDLAIAAEVPTEESKSHDAVVRDRFLSIQPSLLGEYGGKLYAEGPNEALTVIADGLDALVPPPDTSPREHTGADVDPAHESITTQGRRRFDALLWLFGTHPSLTGNPDVTTLPDDWDGPAELILRSGLTLKILLTTDLATLLGVEDHCGQLLSTLTGGRLKVDAKTARRLANSDTTVRTILLDDVGDVLGVGRNARFARGWVADAMRVLWPETITPGSRASAAHGDLDHHVEWDDGGETTVNNLAPITRAFHCEKSRGDWTIRAGPDGSRIVRHVQSGWWQQSFPATRRINLPTDKHKKRKARDPSGRAAPDPPPTPCSDVGGGRGSQSRSDPPV